MYLLSALAAGLVRRFHIDRLNKLSNPLLSLCQPLLIQPQQFHALYMRLLFHFRIEVKRIFNALHTKNFCSHSIHCLGVNAVMPNKSTKHLAERPIFSITTCDDYIFKKISLCFQCLKSAFAARIDASAIVSINMNLRKIVFVYIFRMRIHFIS